MSNKYTIQEIEDFLSGSVTANPSKKMLIDMLISLYEFNNTKNNKSKMITYVADFYAIRNSEGHYFRAKGYGGHGDTWVGDLAKAKLYGNLSAARGRVTWFSREYPDYPNPTIVVISAHATKVLDETDRVTHSINRIKKSKK